MPLRTKRLLITFLTAAIGIAFQLRKVLREVFERLLALLLDEVCKTQLSKAQQGFIRNYENHRLSFIDCNLLV